MSELTLECPCCGDIGATADADGMFFDGQPLECGCPGHVAVDDADPEAEAWVNSGDVLCKKCEARDVI